MMKKMLFACCVLIQILVFSACKEKENSGYQVSSVSIRLVYPEGSGFEPVEGVSVTLKNTSGSTPSVSRPMRKEWLFLKCRKVSMKLRLPTNGWPMPKCIFSMD